MKDIKTFFVAEVESKQKEEEKKRTELEK